MADKLSNYLKGINYEKVGKYEEAFNIFQNDSSDLSLSKIVVYEYLGLGTDKNYKNSLENLKKITGETKEDINQKGMVYRKLATIVGLIIGIILI